MKTMKRLLALAAGVALGACSLADDDEARVNFWVQDTGAGLTASLVNLTWTDDGSRMRVVDAGDFEAESGAAQTDEFETRTSGTLLVDFDIAVPEGIAVSSGEVEIPLRSDWRWTVSFWITDSNPADRCFGCYGSKGFPVAPQYQRTPADSLWVVWSGNSISDPMVY